MARVDTHFLSTASGNKLAAACRNKSECSCQCNLQEIKKVCPEI
jgi:hypothetical protein